MLRLWNMTLSTYCQEKYFDFSKGEADAIWGWVLKAFLRVAEQERLMSYVRLGKTFERPHLTRLCWIVATEEIASCCKYTVLLYSKLQMSCIVTVTQATIRAYIQEVLQAEWLTKCGY